MEDALVGLASDQVRAATHTGGPLLLRGSAGTGKTRTLLARLAWLVDQGEPAESILLVAPSGPIAARLRAQVEERLVVPYEELAVHAPPDLCTRLLEDEALAGGLDPFAVAVSVADRLALLLDRLDELDLRVHDFGGDPGALIASLLRRIDRLKRQLVAAPDYAAWAARLPGSDGGGSDAERVRAAREREFADVYLAHERILQEAGAVDEGGLLARAVALLRGQPHVRREVAARWRHVLADDFQDLDFAGGLVLRLLSCEHRRLVAAGDVDQTIRRFRAAGGKNFADLRAEHPDLTEIVLEAGHRCPERIARAGAAMVTPVRGRAPSPPPAAGPGGDVELWRCANERAQAQAVAADVERLLGRDRVRADRVAILVRSVRDEGRAVAVALDERAVPHRLRGAGALLRRAEVRDMVAWLRLLADPADAGAVVRALSRPPIELGSLDIARCTQIARRRKLDMVAGLQAATESPQVPPEARERILHFLALYRGAAAGFETARPDSFVHELVERLGVRRQLLFAARPEVAERLHDLARLADLAAHYARREPRATARELTAYLAAVVDAGLEPSDEEDEDDGVPAGEASGRVEVLELAAARGREWDHVYILGLHAARLPGARRAGAGGEGAVPDELLKESLPPSDPELHLIEMRRLLHLGVTRARSRVVLAHPQASARGAVQPPSPFAEEVGAALGIPWEDRAEQLFGPAETLHATYRVLRDELLEGIQRTGSRLGELRFDTELDISHAVVRYLEVVKLAALIERSRIQDVAEAMPEINAALLPAVTAEQREILESSSLDDLLLGTEADAARRAAAAAAREEPSLEAFLPRRGDGLVLSASDIESYRACPLKYKFARVFRIPSEPTLNQRFGIAVHQVLERFHADPRGAASVGEMLDLLDTAWRRGGFGSSDNERQLRDKATSALVRYHERFMAEESEPVWFERQFSFRMGRHLLRGRVDRVDRLPDGAYELIDYKTGRPRTVGDLREDVQLSLYAVGAREAWSLDTSCQSYYYVLDDEKVEVPRDERDRDWIEDTVAEVAGGIEAQGFEPTPSYKTCSWCDYRIVCPAAER